VWLSRDLEYAPHSYTHSREISLTVWSTRTNTFWTLKICTTEHGSVEVNNEVLVSRHVATVEGEHPGRDWIRLSHDDFQIKSDEGMHQCLVFRPMGMTFTEFRNMLPARALPKDLLQKTLHILAVALDFLHQAEVVHTGQDSVPFC
jgi:hypothetical protein